MSLVFYQLLHLLWVYNTSRTSNRGQILSNVTLQRWKLEKNIWSSSKWYHILVVDVHGTSFSIGLFVIFKLISRAFIFHFYVKNDMDMSLHERGGIISASTKEKSILIFIWRKRIIFVYNLAIKNIYLEFNVLTTSDKLNQIVIEQWQWQINNCDDTYHQMGFLSQIVIRL